MQDFMLDSRLAGGCIQLGRLNGDVLLLMNNALVPWFILVPVTGVCELFELEHAEQQRLYRNVNFVSSFVKNYFAVEKLNVAAIGNIVKQLHVHIVGRHPADYCWPNVVWGRQERVDYAPERIAEIAEALQERLGQMFSAA